MTKATKSKLESLTSKLETAEQRLTHALDAADVGIWEWDLRNNNLYFDRRMLELYEYEDGEWKENYESWRCRVHPDDIILLEKRIKACIENDEPYVYWFRIKSKIKPDGWKYVKGKGRVIRDESNNPILMTGVNLESDCPKEFLNFSFRYLK